MAGCYRPRSEFVLLGDLNWDMLKPPEKVVQQFDSLNLHQIVTHPTRYPSNTPDKATLLDVVFTNSPHMYQSGVFCNEISDHCFIARVCKFFSACHHQ